MQALLTCKNFEQLSFLTFDVKQHFNLPFLYAVILECLVVAWVWSEPTSKRVTDWQVNLLCHCFSQSRSTNSMHCQIRCSRINYENKWDVPLVFIGEDSLYITWGGGDTTLLIKKTRSMVVYACADLCVHVHVFCCCLNMSEQCNFNAVCCGLGHILFCVPATAVTASLYVINSSVQEWKKRKKKSERDREIEKRQKGRIHM